MKPLTRGALLTGLALALAACAIEPLPAPGQASRPQSPIRQEGAPPPPPRRADPRDIARISRLMIPLLRVAERHRPVDQVRVGILDDPSINAASAGEGKFFVTRGLLERATDEQLQAVLAHEVAHDDLGHVAKLQTVGAGVELGAAILEQIFPGAAQLTPLAGTLITRAYSRSEELEADRHGAELLRRVGSSKEALERALLWLKSISGGSGGGFLATHPGIDERIQALRRMR